MIHLAVARLVSAPACRPLYFIGAWAPDAMRYPEKEHAHLRYEADRAAALAELAHRTDPGDDFNEGVLLHLYTDWKWDETHLRVYRNQADPDDRDWFKHYQHETTLASAWLYWNEAWGPALWEAMLAVPAEEFGSFADITPKSITDYLLRNSARLEESKGPPSAFYPPELVEEFVKATAETYKKWRM